MKLILFAKHLKGLDVPSLVQEAKRSQVDGFDFPVREGFAVHPGNVATALAELVAALESEELCLPMCTAEGDLVDPDKSEVEPLLAAMAENHVPFLKMGYFLFDAAKQDYWREVDRVRGLLARWEKAAARHGVTVCCHTHSGRYMGCNASSLLHLIRGFDPQYIGAYLDAGHLSAGGEEFPMACRIAGEYLKVVGVKEVVRAWDEIEGRRIVRGVHAPIGKGLLDLNVVFSHLVRTGFDGPVSIHVEYKGTQEELIAGGRRDAGAVRAALDAARGR